MWWRSKHGSGITAEMWKRMTRDPVEQEARLIAVEHEGKETNWEAHAWEAYKRVLARWAMEK